MAFSSRMLPKFSYFLLFLEIKNLYIFFNSLKEKCFFNKKRSFNNYQDLSSVEIVNSLRVLKFSSSFKLFNFTIRIFDFCTVQL